MGNSLLHLCSIFKKAVVSCNKLGIDFSAVDRKKSTSSFILLVGPSIWLTVGRRGAPDLCTFGMP